MGLLMGGLRGRLHELGLAGNPGLGDSPVG